MNIDTTKTLGEALPEEMRRVREEVLDPTLLDRLDAQEAEIKRLTAKLDAMKATLECDHCGDVAIESQNGSFQQNDGRWCMSCGMPGHVEVEVDAWWVTDNADGNCYTQPDCEECEEHRASLVGSAR